MKKYYKVIKDGYIIGVGTNGPDSCTGTTKAKYEEIRDLILNKPEHDDSHDYLLKEDLTWEPVSVDPPSEEVEDSEALQAIEEALS